MDLALNNLQWLICHETKPALFLFFFFWLDIAVMVGYFQAVRIFLAFSIFMKFFTRYNFV